MEKAAGVLIYQRVHKDEQESVSTEVSPLRKYPILPVRQRRLRRITAMGPADLFYEKSSIVARLPG